MWNDPSFITGAMSAPELLCTVGVQNTITVSTLLATLGHRHLLISGREENRLGVNMLKISLQAAAAAAACPQSSTTAGRSDGRPPAAMRGDEPKFGPNLISPSPRVSHFMRSINTKGSTKFRSNFHNI